MPLFLSALLLLSLPFLFCGEVCAGDGFILRAGTLHTGLRAIDDGVIVVIDNKVMRTGSWIDLEGELSDHLPRVSPLPTGQPMATTGTEIIVLC